MLIRPQPTPGAALDTRPVRDHAAMSTPGYALPTATTRDQALSIFGQVMGLVAITCAFAALGAYIGRDLTGAWWILPWLAGDRVHHRAERRERPRQPPARARPAVRASGCCSGSSVGDDAQVLRRRPSPSALYQAAGGDRRSSSRRSAPAGYAIRRDLSGLYRLAFFLLLGLIVFGIVVIFVRMPGGDLIYAILGLGVFGLYTVLDFNRLRRAGQGEVIPLAAGIFLDVFNIFLFFLRIFGSR